MITQIKIPDGTFEQYRQHKPAEPELAISQQVIRFAGVSPSDRILILPQKERAELELLLDQHLTSAKELVNCVKELLQIKVAGVDVPVSPATLVALAQQAEYEAAEPKEFYERKVGEAFSVVVNGYV